MDRDPRENVIDPVERVSPASGDNDTGDAGDEEARIERERQDKGAQQQGAKSAGAGVGSSQDGEDPNTATDRSSEKANPGIHGGTGDSGW